MSKETTKLKVAVVLNNGDYHRVECSSIDFDTTGVELYGTRCDVASIKYEDIVSMSIFADVQSEQDKLTFRLVREPKVEREV